MAACLNSLPTNGVAYTAAAISACLASGNTTDLNLAICLATQNQIIQDHRFAKQSDLNSCSAAATNAGIAGCLARRGLRNAVTQAGVDQCLVAPTGLAGLEKCLRTNNLLPRRPGLFQGDANLCVKVEGGTTGLALCLQNGDVLPASVTQAQIDTCIANVTVNSVVRCLRVNYHVPNVLMQAHFNECNNNVGQANISACLDANGLLPVPVANIAAFQAEVDACVTTATAAGIARCMRGKNFISPRIMQPHIASCFDAVGLNAFNCLNANFVTLPAGMTDLELRDCFALNNNTPVNAARCLSLTKRILPTAPLQDHINACSRFAGNQPDVTRPGAVGIAECLNRSGLQPAPLAQANIDTCITSAGLGGVAGCLHTQGIVPAYSRLAAAGGIFATSCAGCHGALMPGNLNVSVYASLRGKVIPGNSAGSLLNTRITNPVAAMRMPPPPAAALPAASIATIQRWIDQGANEN